MTLYPEYPNPFTSEINITFYISNSGDVELDIYNISGQKVKTIIQKELKAGNYSFIWNCKNDNEQSVNLGIYLFYLKMNGKIILIKKCLLMK
jgi:flagellar hook assembly protein FlgD